MGLKMLGLAALVTVESLLLPTLPPPEESLQYNLSYGLRKNTIGHFIVEEDLLDLSLVLPIVKEIRAQFSKDDSTYTEFFDLKLDETFTYNMRNDTAFFKDYISKPINEKLEEYYTPKEGTFSSDQMTAFDIMQSTFVGLIPDTIHMVLHAQEYLLVTTEPLTQVGLDRYTLQIKPLPYDIDNLGMFYLADGIDIELIKNDGVYIPSKFSTKVTIKKTPLKIRVRAELNMYSPMLSQTETRGD